MSTDPAKQLELLKKNVKTFCDSANKYSAEIKPWKTKYEEYKVKRKEAYQLSNGKYPELSKRKKELKQKIEHVTTELKKLDDELGRNAVELGKEKESITKASASLGQARTVLSHIPELEKMQDTLADHSRVLHEEINRLADLIAKDPAKKTEYMKLLRALEAEFDKGSRASDMVIDFAGTLRGEDAKFPEAFMKFSSSVERES